MSDRIVPDENISGGGTHYPGRINWKIEKTPQYIIVKYKALSFIPILFVGLTCMLLGFLVANYVKINSVKILISILTIITALFIVCTMFFVNRNYISKEDWLILDLNNSMVKLPRIPDEVKKSDIHLIQVIIGIPGFGDRYLTEVNLVADIGLNYKRYPLIKAGSPNLVKELVFELSKILSVDIQKVEYSLSGKKTITKHW